MGLTGADDFPKRAVVSDCEPFTPKGHLKEGATAQTRPRGSAALWHSALRMAFSGAGAALGLDLLPGSGGVRSGFLLLPGHRLPGQQWTPPHLGTEPWLLWGNRPRAQAARREAGSWQNDPQRSLLWGLILIEGQCSMPALPNVLVGCVDKRAQLHVKNEYANE